MSNIILTYAGDLQATRFRYEPYTSAEILAIVAPEPGQKVFNTDDNIEYFYDASRLKWLSTDSIPWQFGSDGGVDNSTIRYNNMNSATVGPLLGQAATVTSITLINDAGQADKGIEVHETGVPIFTFSLVAGSYTSNTVNADFAAANVLSVFAVAAGANINDPAAVVTTRWRVV